MSVYSRVRNDFGNLFNFTCCYLIIYRAAAAQREAETIKLAPVPEPTPEPDPAPLPTPTPIIVIEEPLVTIEEPEVPAVVTEVTVREPTPEGSGLFNNIAKRVSLYFKANFCIVCTCDLSCRARKRCICYLHSCFFNICSIL